MRKITNYIDGKSVNIAKVKHWKEVFCPATGEVVAKVQQSNEQDASLATDAAAKVLASWREIPAIQRSRVLYRFLQLLEEQKGDVATSLSMEHGKTIEDSLGEISRGLEVVEFACGIPHLIKGEFSENVGTAIDSWSVRQPMGVCAGVTPFNFPVMVPMWMWPIAIACGNTFILKPSAEDPSCSNKIADVLKQAGLPDGVFNVVHGGDAPVNALLHDERVSAISFVGSTPVAKYIFETGAVNGKRVQALGGAKNHLVVLPDADLEIATNALIGAAYGSAGERCMAVSVAVAVGNIADDLVSLLKSKALNLKVGNSMDKGLDMGPLISAKSQQRVLDYIDKGVSEGAELVVDGRGKQVLGYEDGYFVFPTLFDKVTADMVIYQDEIFGPVLCVVRVDTVEQATLLINAQKFANGVSIFTEKGYAARQFVNQIEVGMVGVNVPIPAPTAFYSFGGWKNSLFGANGVHGMEGVRFYTRQKTVTTRWLENKNLGAEFSFPVNK